MILKHRTRRDLDPAPVVAHPKSVRNHYGTSRGRLLGSTCRRQQGYERLGTSIQRWDLTAIDLDFEVVDTEAGRRRHQVFNRLDAGTVAPDSRRVV